MFKDRGNSKRSSSLQRSETYSTREFVAEHIALRWSASRTLKTVSINIWLLWSQIWRE